MEVWSTHALTAHTSSNTMAFAHNGICSEYIVVYIHTALSPENEPPLAWFRKVFDLFDRRLKVRLKVHPILKVHPTPY